MARLPFQKEDFDQYLQRVAPECWSKYTTFGAGGMKRNNLVRRIYLFQANIFF